MYKCINGWTKKKVLAVLKKRKYEVAARDGIDGSCVYKTARGNKCAVGMFIPKNHEGFELSGTVFDLIDVYPDLEQKMPLNLLGMSELQRVHDAEENRRCAKTKMIEWIKKNVRD